MENLQSIKMERNLSIAHEITWPKEFPELKIIDDALRCGICYDYIKTCMVTPCAHSYCSICIRRSLHYKTACPICFEETFETNLRNNRVLDRVTELFVTIKDKLIKHLRIAAIHFNCNEQLQSPQPSQILTSQRTNIQDATPKRDIQKSSKCSSTKGKLNFPSTSFTSTSAKKSDISKKLEDILGSPVANGPKISEFDVLVSPKENQFSKIPTVPPMFLQPKIETQPKALDVPTVPCPVCGVTISERNINAHLDNCLANVDKSPVKSPIKPRQKRNPLPKMVWSLMAEKDLRKKLKEYGLNTQGDKKLLISRIQRYILLYNSECDSDNPRPISEIIRQVERDEKQAPMQSQQKLVLNKKTDPKIIEEENKKYLQNNKDSFKKLIEIMKEREGRNIRPQKWQCNRITSDDEDDFIGSNREKGISKCSNEMPSTSKFVGVSVDLCDSSDANDVSMSPILGSCGPDDQQLCNEFTAELSDDVISPNSKSSKMNTTSYDDGLKQLSSVQKSPNMKLKNNSSLCNSFEEVHVSPSQTPSPSCIVSTQYSDSEDSISLLVDYQNTGGEDFLDNPLEAVPDNLQQCNSQLDDPDFVLDTEDQLENGNCSEEVFVPRKSKRKRKSPVPAASKQNPSPRLTRRRLSK